MTAIISKNNLKDKKETTKNNCFIDLITAYLLETEAK